MKPIFFMMAMVMACCGNSATTWHVAKTGKDTNSGKSESAAFLTIQKAVDSASAGDTVVVDNGTYVPSSTSKYGVINSDKKIKIRSKNGYAHTIIDAKDKMCCFYDGGNYNYTNCVLIGFSLINGHSPGNFNMGGAAIGGMVIDCCVSNCFAQANAGAGHFTKFINCLLVKNWTTDGYASVAYSSTLINCTLVDNYIVGSLAGGQSAVYDCTLRNCILWKNRSSGNSIVTTGTACTVLNCCTADPKFNNESAGDYRLSSKSPCINAGNNSYVLWDVDLAGNPRKNGTVDIGAFEYYPPSATVEGVIASPRYPWNGLVDLKFTIKGDSGVKFAASFTAKDVVGNTNLTMKTLCKSNGGMVNAAKEQLLPGVYNWLWDAAADLGQDAVLERVVISISVQ